MMIVKEKKKKNTRTGTGTGPRGAHDDEAPAVLVKAHLAGLIGRRGLRVGPELLGTCDPIQSPESKVWSPDGADNLITLTLSRWAGTWAGGQGSR